VLEFHRSRIVLVYPQKEIGLRAATHGSLVNPVLSVDSV
jgi:hypothetical protein